MKKVNESSKTHKRLYKMWLNSKRTAVLNMSFADFAEMQVYTLNF